MGIFEAVWMTKDEKKRGKAVKRIEKIKDVDKLNRIVLSAPLATVRGGAIRQLRSVTGGTVPFGEEESEKTLLKLNVDYVQGYYVPELSWYEDMLFKKVLEEKRLLNIALRAENRSVRRSAVYRLKSTECLEKIAESPDAPEEIRTLAIEQCKSRIVCGKMAVGKAVPVSAPEAEARFEEMLKKLALDGSLPMSVRTAAVKNAKDQELLTGIAWSGAYGGGIRAAAVANITDRAELERIKNGTDDINIKRSACGKLGHRMRLEKYVPHGNGGKDALYICEDCGESRLEPYEWSSADSV